MFRLLATAAAAILCAIPAAAISKDTVQNLFDKPAASKGAVFDTQRYRAEVKVDANKLFALKPGSRLTLAVPGLDAYPVVFDRAVSRDNGTREWIGHVAGKADEEIILTDTGGVLTGIVRTPHKTFRLTHESGANWLVWEYGAALPAANARTEPAQGVHVLPWGSALMSPAGGPLREATAHTLNLPAHGVHETAINLAALTNLAEKEEATIALPNAGSVRVVYDGTETSDSGAATWVGHLRDHGTDYRVVLTYTGDHVEGRVLAPSGEYLIHTIGERQYIVDVRRSGMIPMPFTEADTVTPSQSVRAMAAPLPGTPDAAASTIDLLVLVTPGFEKAKGGADKARTRIDQLVALANQAYKDSGVAMKLRVVQVQQINYADNTVNSDALDQLGYGKGAFSGVFALRDKVGADMVTLLRPFNYAAQKTCGTAYLAAANGRPMAGFSDYAFSVVSDGHDTAAGRYCTDYGLAHELGHNMGNKHDRATERAAGDTSTGAFPYAFGFGVEGRFGTIMSYQSPRVGKFSNPNDHSCGGNMACGVSENDVHHAANDALSLNNVRIAIAAFRPTRVPQTHGISGTITRDGKGLANVTVTADGAKCTRTGSSGTYSCTASSGWSGVLKPKLAGYSFKPGSIRIDALQGGISRRNFTAIKTQ